MSFINKVKNFFYEDIEEDDEEFEAREAAKREAKLRKIEEKRKKQEEEKRFEKTVELKKPSNDDLSERELFKSERTFNFPMDIADNIFDDYEENAKTEVIEREENRSTLKEEKNLYARSNRTVTPTTTTPTRSILREEPKEEGPKKFHPSPVVSPVYGVLDKNYTVEDVVDKNLSKTKEFSIEKKIVDFDTVRNKAYKDLDDELEQTLTKTKDIFYNLEDEEKTDEIEDIKDLIEEEYDKDENNEDDVVITYEGEEEVKEPVIEEEEEDIEEDISPDIEIPKEEPVEKKTRSRRKKVEEKEEPEEDDEEKEDLFNLIDNMYSDDEDEEEED